MASLTASTCVALGLLFRRVLNDVFHRTAALGGINGGEFVRDGFFGRDQRGDFQLGDALDVVEGEDVERVGHREEQFVFQPGNGNDFVVIFGFARQQVGDFLRDGDAREVDGRDVEHAAHAHGQVLLADVGLVHDELDEARAFLLLLFEQFLHLPGAQQAVLDERVGDAFSE